MEFSLEQKKYIIQRIKFSYSKGYFEGMVSGIILSNVLGFAIFSLWSDVAYGSI